MVYGVSSIGPFDYIIVGGGTAGCILANRLSASGRHSVLMLEAGGEPRSPWIPIPAGFSKLLTSRRYNWLLETQPEPNTLNRRIAVPRGKGLGGSSLINGMIYVRGQRGDYDDWESAGATGWGYSSVEPYFRKIETFVSNDPRRGQCGPMHIDTVAERFPIAGAFLAAAVEDGQPLNDDYNLDDQLGFGYYQALQKNGRRWSVVDGYLRPARNRPNLTIVKDAHVKRLIFDGKRCHGVRYALGNLDVAVDSNLEVLLCAGAVHSPQLLELSGVGNPELLQSLELPVVHPLPGVGENYIDHYATRMNWRIRNTVTLNEMSRGWRLAKSVAQYLVTRRGILTLGTGLVHGFVKTRSDLPTPDVQYFFIHASYANAAERILDNQPGMTLGVTQLRPRSTGSIHSKSPDPARAPAIKPNFLDHPEDRRSLIAGMKIARRIVSQPAMARYVDHEMCPGESVLTDDAWLEFARENGQTIYHPLGTCRIGKGPDSVVNPALCVRGLAGLRVVDASVMPGMVSGNIQAAVMVVAEKAADLILADQRAG